MSVLAAPWLAILGCWLALPRSAGRRRRSRPLPALNARVTDLTGTLTPPSRGQLEQQHRRDRPQAGGADRHAAAADDRSRRASSSSASASPRPGRSGRKGATTA
jgi:hypothetical protein